MKKILFLTNGHGEDQTAAQIIKRLPKELDVIVYPLVGEGKEFESLNVKLLEPRRTLPGGGFSLRNFWSLPYDLVQGLFTLFYMQIKKLRELKGQFDLVVGIGDVVPMVGALITKSTFMFVGVNKSDYYRSFGYNYTFWEKWLLKKYSKKTYTRDEITAKSLSKIGIKAEYAGNPIMDGLGSHQTFPKSQNEYVIGFLPGTRTDDVNKNIIDFEKIALELKKFNNKFRFLIALKDKEVLEKNAAFEIMSFEDVIFNSDIIIGLSGTGNEQAAGIGKPVVGFVGRGAQYNKKFAKAQQQLLGAALSLTKRSPHKIAERVWEILNDKPRQKYMANTGIVRMGGPGAIEKIAKDIVSMVK